jgi:CheY-like chemotaxis protein
MASDVGIKVGNVPIGGGAPVVVQSMTMTRTRDVEATTAQIAALASAGCEVVRCAVPKTEDAEALARIVRLSPIPVIADIHFNASLALKAIAAGVAAVRINPGNIGGPDKVELVVDAARKAGIPRRIGANSGSLPKHLHGLAQTVIIKDVTTMERLLDETALFLHRVEANLPERKQRVLRRLAKSDPQLAERNVLVVDDDLRNIFALTSLLEGHKMNVLYAENGKRALAKLEENPGIDVVLMDIMMPEMDGYEAVRRIRERSEWKDLPVIALTAKAMKGDREKCLEAGASDYITKPVDADQLLSLLRVWLYQS